MLGDLAPRAEIGIDPAQHRRANIRPITLATLAVLRGPSCKVSIRLSTRLCRLSGRSSRRSAAASFGSTPWAAMKVINSSR